MIKIGTENIYVGTKDEITIAENKNMCIVNAIRNCKGYKCHQSEVKWIGRSCDKDSPYYLFKENENELFLNLIDTEDVKYIPKEIITRTIEFIDKKLRENKSVFICCSLGESRSPSLALMYMLDKNKIKFENCINTFKNDYYPNYNPKRGFVDYILSNFNN